MTGPTGTLANPARYWGRTSPRRVMLVYGDREVTWGEFDERTSRLAAALVARGIEPGERVATLVENCVEFCEVAVAAFKAGAVLVPLNHRLAPVELADIVRRSGVACIAATAALLRPVAAVGIDCVRHVLVVGDGDDELGPQFDAVIAASPVDDPRVEVADHQPAVICFTSGTTGLPKGVMLSHRNVMAVVTERILCDDWGRTEVGYLPYAIAFTGGLVCMWMPLYVLGATTVLDRSFDASRALRTIVERKITAFIAVPTVLGALAAHPHFATADLSSLRTLGTGGSRVPLELLEAFRAVGLGVAQGYGLTEGGGINLILDGTEALDHLGSCGRSVVNGRAKVIDEHGAPCAPGEVGELVLRGPTVMEGYWQDPVETERAFIDGWLRTGDLVTMDEQGYVRIVDRKKDMLISGGLNVYPAEIERVLDTIEGIDEAAVVGVPDARWGEVAVAIVVGHGSLNADDVLAACSARLGRYKVPKRVFFRAEPLPRGMSGKVLKRELREDYAARYACGDE